MLSIIENKLPQNIAERWYRKMYEEKSDIDRKNKFPALLSFLKAERDALEYGLSELRYTTHKTSSFNLCDGAVYDNDVNANCMLNEKNVNTKCLIHNVSDHTTTDCNIYNNKYLNDKFYILRRNRACYSCLLPGHSINNCTNKRKCSEDCNQFHHKSLHNYEINAINSYIDPDQKYNPACLLQIQRIKIGDCNGKFANVFWDGGSSISLITESMARKLGLSGSPIRLNVTTVRGMEQTIESHKYSTALIDKNGKKYKLDVYGIDSITNEISDIRVDKIIHLFNDIHKGDVERPSGNIDLDWHGVCGMAPSERTVM